MARPSLNSRLFTLLLCLVVILLLTAITILSVLLSLTSAADLSGSECPPGHLFIANKCHPCSLYHANCSDCYDLDTCTKCEEGHELVDFEC